MYIFEIIARKLKQLKQRKNIENFQISEDEYEMCNHIYLAIDSTKDYLACNKCGHVIKNEKSESQNADKRNIFKIFD